MTLRWEPIQWDEQKGELVKEGRKHLSDGDKLTVSELTFTTAPKKPELAQSRPAIMLVFIVLLAGLAGLLIAVGFAIGIGWRLAQ